MEINSKSENFLEMKKEEKEKFKKSQSLEKRLKLNEENNRYKEDRYKYFK